MTENGSILPEWLIGSRRHPPLEQVGVLVIGGDYRGLGVTRSLGRHGIPVWILTDNHFIGATSRYARRSLRWPTTCEAQQIDFLLNMATQHRLEGWVVFPTGDETTALLARHHNVLAERFRLTTPPWETIRWAHDKRLTHDLAAKLGIDYPWTAYPTSREDVMSLDYAFPVILKPAVREGFNRFVHDKAWRVEDQAALLKKYDEARALVPRDVIMVQELIPGCGESQFSYAALCLNGKPLASITAQRTRQYPMDFGRSSSYVETLDLPEIEEPSRWLLATINYTGLIEVEFKRDSRDGRYKLLDINPRVWGWHTLGRRAGVDFPHLLWQLIKSKMLLETRARVGVRWVRMVTDLPTVAHEILQGRLSLHAYLKSLKGPLEAAIFAMDDPLPALAEIPLLSYLALKRGAA